MVKTPHKVEPICRPLGKPWLKPLESSMEKTTKPQTSGNPYSLPFPSKSWNPCSRVKPKPNWDLQTWEASCLPFVPLSTTFLRPIWTITYIKTQTQPKRFNVKSFRQNASAKNFQELGNWPKTGQKKKTYTIKSFAIAVCILAIPKTKDIWKLRFLSQRETRLPEVSPSPGT